MEKIKKDVFSKELEAQIEKVLKMGEDIQSNIKRKKNNIKMFIDEYQKLYEKSRIWEKNTWFGIPMWKLPFDAFVIQELIVEIRPQYIIETGTGHGGSAMFYAAICELLGEGGVISIDIDGSKRNSNKWGNFQWEDRITFLHGGSTNPLTIKEIYKATGWNDLERRYYGNGGLVILDSWHTKEHVLKEMELYSEFVDVDSYMIVEDTHVNGHPVPWEYGEGPHEAVDEWLKKHKNWEIDFKCEKHLMTFNPNGYLKRIEGGE